MLASRLVRRRLNTHTSTPRAPPPPPHQREACCFAGKDLPSSPLQRELSRGVGKEEFGLTCENVYMDLGAEVEQIHMG